MNGNILIPLVNGLSVMISTFWSRIAVWIIVLCNITRSLLLKINAFLNLGIVIFLVTSRKQKLEYTYIAFYDNNNNNAVIGLT